MEQLISSENKMGTMPVRKLLITMSLPMMFSMLVQALYNIVDSIFVAMISENAFTAVSLSFPVQNLIISIAVGTGVGMGSLLSRFLGEKRQRMVNKTAANGLIIYLFSYLLILLFGIFFTRPFFEVQSSVKEITDFGYDYLFICAAGSFFVFIEIYFSRLLQSTGRTLLSMISQLTGSITNIILDPVLIFSCGMGIKGAAIATVMGQAVGALTAFLLNVLYNKDIQFKFKYFLPDFKVIGKIYSVGLPSILMQSVGSVALFFMNKILAVFGETAVNVFGAFFKTQSFFFMPVFGLNNGMVPIVAYNFGAKNKERIMKTVKLSVSFAILIMGLGVLIMQIFPEALLGMFNASDDMLRLGVPALRIISLSFFGAAVSICLNSVSQALGNGVYSFIVAFSRQIILLLPAAFLLSLTGNLNLVWLAFPIAEVGSVIISLLFFKDLYKNKICRFNED